MVALVAFKEVMFTCASLTCCITSCVSLCFFSNSSDEGAPRRGIVRSMSGVCKRGGATLAWLGDGYIKQINKYVENDKNQWKSSFSLFEGIYKSGERKG